MLLHILYTLQIKTEKCIQMQKSILIIEGHIDFCIHT